MSRLIRSLLSLSVFAIAAAGAWLGVQYLRADGLSPIDTAVVGLAAFVIATVVAFSRA